MKVELPSHSQRFNNTVKQDNMTQDTFIEFDYVIAHLLNIGINDVVAIERINPNTFRYRRYGHSTYETVIIQ